MRAVAALLMLFLLPAATLGPEHCRTVEVLDEAGRSLAGIEDLAIHPPSGRLILSAHDRWAGAAGEGPRSGLYAVGLDEVLIGGRPAGRLLTPGGPHGADDVIPHGLAIRPEPTGGYRLAVINHRAWQRHYDRFGRPGTMIEEYLVRPDGTLEFRRSVGGADLCAANDLDWVDADVVAVTLDREHCGGWLRWLELSTGQNRGRVVLIHLGSGARTAHIVDGLSAAEADLGFPNGIAALPGGGDARGVIVSMSREAVLTRFFVRRQFDAEVALARDSASLPTEGGGDNLSWDSGGRLLLAVHPSVWRFGLYSLRVPGFATAPSRLLRIDLAGESVATIYDDPEGDLFSGATSVIEAGGHFIAGAAFDSGLLVCPADG